MTDCDRVADSRISWNALLGNTAGYLRDDRDTKGLFRRAPRALGFRPRHASCR